MVENLLLMVSWIPFFKDAEKNILIKLIIMFLQNPCFTQKKRFSLLSKIKTINILVDNLENFWKHSLIDPFLKNNKMQRRTLFLSTFKNKNHKYIWLITWKLLTSPYLWTPNNEDRNSEDRNSEDRTTRTETARTEQRGPNSEDRRSDH